MDLIKENKEKQRKVYKSPTFYRKVWEQQPFEQAILGALTLLALVAMQ